MATSINIDEIRGMWQKRRMIQDVNKNACSVIVAAMTPQARDFWLNYECNDPSTENMQSPAKWIWVG